MREARVMTFTRPSDDVSTARSISAEMTIDASVSPPWPVASTWRSPIVSRPVPVCVSKLATGGSTRVTLALATSAPNAADSWSPSTGRSTSSSAPAAHSPDRSWLSTSSATANRTPGDAIAFGLGRVVGVDRYIASSKPGTLDLVFITMRPPSAVQVIALG